MLWERAVASLPPPLLVALRSSGLDDPGTLVEYTRSSVEELERGLGRTLVGLDALAPSGAASSGQSTITYGHKVPVLAPEWSVVASGSGDVGGDPKTDHFVRDPGGDPKTDHFVPQTGGDPRTDHFVPDDESLLCREMAATCPPYRPGAVAPQTANPSALAPTAVLGFSVGGGHPDEFSILRPEHPDGFPSTAESRDGLPSSADSKDHTDLDSTHKSTGFTPILHIAENSERLRESDFGVQIVPASRSPSELSAHQMGLSLAGTSRLKIEPIASTGILDIGEPVKLSISDRVLLRRFNSSEQGKEDSQNSASFKQEDSKTVSRVDGRSPVQSLSLYDRMLLRKYPDAGTKSILSLSSSIVSSLPVAHSGGSVKKRRRFYGKGNSDKANAGAVAQNEESPDQEGSPCGFPSKVAGPSVQSGRPISQSMPVSGLFDFSLLFFHTRVG